MTGWSEVGQVRVFREIQISWQGLPRTILCDREYNKGSFSAYCNSLNIELTPVLTNAHEYNLASERINRTLRFPLDRLRCGNQRSPAVDIVSEVTYAKISTVGPGQFPVLKSCKIGPYASRTTVR